MVPHWSIHLEQLNKLHGRLQEMITASHFFIEQLKNERPFSYAHIYPFYLVKFYVS